MSPSFVRGNRLIVVQEPPSKVAQSKPSTISFGASTHPQMGDKLTVGGRKKGGWLRVKNPRRAQASLSFLSWRGKLLALPRSLFMVFVRYCGLQVCCAHTGGATSIFEMGVWELDGGA